MRKTWRWTLAAAMSIAAGTGCSSALSHAVTSRDVITVDGGISLVVRNHTPTDMEIFVVDGGAWTSIGVVVAASTATLDVPGLNDSGAPLQILATPVGRHDSAARAGPLLVHLGQTVTFTIEPELARSFAVVR